MIQAELGVLLLKTLQITSKAPTARSMEHILPEKDHPGPPWPQASSTPDLGDSTLLLWYSLSIILCYSKNFISEYFSELISGHKAVLFGESPSFLFSIGMNLTTFQHFLHSQ